MKVNKSTQERRNTMAALYAVAALGGKFHDVNGIMYGEGIATMTLFEYTREYSPEIRNAVVESRAEAINAGAYFVERAFVSGDGRGREVYGWRLCSFTPGTNGAHSSSRDYLACMNLAANGDSWARYSGEVFATADGFWSAMRTVADLAERAKRAPAAA